MKIGIPSRTILLLTAIAVLAFASPAPAQDAPAQDAPAQGAPAGFSFPIKNGKIVESIDRGIFTYMEIRAGEAHFWVVAPICGVKAGDAVEVPEGKYYASIQSEDLGVTFDNFIVPTKLIVNGQEIKAMSAHDLPRGCIVRRPAKQ